MLALTIPLKVFIMGFVISLSIAVLIKVMLAIIRFFGKKAVH